jgi:membrane protein YqaA with SNARE-associated domain
MHVLAGLFLVFLYEIGAAAILPTPAELPLVTYKWLPVGWMTLFAVVGKIVGSYLVFFLGDRMKNTERFHRLVARYDVLSAVMKWSERFVRRYGVFAVFLLLCIPGFPDTISLYLFALIGQRPVLFSLAAGAATAVRFGLVILGVWSIGQVAQ